MTDNIKSKGRKHSLIGRTVADRYEVIDFIGQGAMGSVYKAKHTAMPKFFAIKTLTAQGLQDERSVARFKQEAQAMSVLNHPHLISIADYGQLDCDEVDDAPYFVMEYLEGISLSDYLKKNGPMPLTQALPLFVQIADALTHAHSKQLIHRDLKPSNIMLIGDKRDFAKVVDLGIAKVAAEGESQSLTHTGEVFGSPLYMSPEQCMGTPLDGRSDIYSFGCLMFEVLTGRTPLKGETFVQTAYKHMNETAPLLRQVRPELNEDIEIIVDACLRKRPEDRVQSMAELREMLQGAAEINCASIGMAAISQQNGTVKSPSQANTLPDPSKGRRDYNEYHGVVPPPPAGVPASGSLKTKILVGGSVTTAVLALLAVAFLLGKTSSPITVESEVKVQTGTPDNLQQVVNRVDDSAIVNNSNSSITVESPVFKRDNPAAREEVDVIAVYAANLDMLDPKKMEAMKEAPPTVEVVITPRPDPITLVLFSYMPVHWKLTPQFGANIKKVVASGYFDQKISNASCGDVSSMCRSKDGDKAFHTANLFYTNQSQAEQNREATYEAISSAVKRMLGKEIRHFEGTYYGDKFKI